jgi:hypothetical protein
VKIIIETIPHSQQRYNTVGDWYLDAYGSLIIKVSEITKRYEWLIAIHELVEAILCECAGITAAQVDKWDKEHIEAGDDPEAPYHRQHIFADAIERLVALELGVRWDPYEKELNKLG